MLESRAAQPAAQLSDRLQSRAWRKSRSQGTSGAAESLSAAESLLLSLFPPTTGKGACPGLASATGQCGYPVTDFSLQALGSNKHRADITSSQPHGGQWLTLSLQEQADWAGNSEPTVHQLQAFRASPFQWVCATSATLVQAVGPAPGAGASSATIPPQDRRSQEWDAMFLKLIIPRAVMSSAAASC